VLVSGSGPDTGGGDPGRLWRRSTRPCPRTGTNSSANARTGTNPGTHARTNPGTHTHPDGGPTGHTPHP
ncbi:MAG: hypothetical protein V1780_03050, partial [Chloroflexota bacterium]